jgi:hypothetical protein
MLDEILGLRPVAEPPGPRSPFVSEHYRGSNRSALQFRDGRLIDGFNLDRNNADATAPAAPAEPPTSVEPAPEQDDGPSAMRRSGSEMR